MLIVYRTAPAIRPPGVCHVTRACTVFEWEILANIDSFETEFGLVIDRFGRGCAISMLVSHWFYLIAASMGLFRCAQERETEIACAGKLPESTRASEGGMAREDTLCRMVRSTRGLHASSVPVDPAWVSMRQQSAAAKSL